ncbi:MAG: NACHT domain-containing protein [Clostridiaceae bacterium]|nr:NACHT domain-containing protein [Clostridiaceae bacterium]
MNAEIKRGKLRELVNEVNKFHPVLETLFRNMEELEAVDYTHGVNEKGADFVLTRYDSLLSETFYIGVIAKTGKIQSDFSDIERQIEECELHRYTLNGKKNVILSEIWVITNETISINAREKINHKYKDKKIVFLDYQNIIKWIDKYLPNYWFDFGVKTGHYLDLLHQRILDIDRQLNLVKCTTEPFYIEQDIYERVSEYKQNRIEKSKKVNIFDHVRSHKITIVESSMGGGKSKLIRKIATHYSEGDFYATHAMLPVVLSYKDFIVKYKGNIDNTIESEIGESILKELKIQSKILLLIDGVDEYKASIDEQIGSLEESIKNIQKVSNVHALFTTRPLRASNEQKGVIDNVTMLEIRPLSLSRILEFLQKICQRTNISSRIIEDLKRSQLFKELPKTPISAMILANLLNENSKELPANITELYSKFSELALGRWDVDKGLQSQKEYEAADSVIMLLSEYFIDNSLTSISIGEAKSFIKDYLNKRHLSIDSDNLYDKLINRSGLLVENIFNQTVVFKHRTITEFFYAKSHEKKNDLKIDERIFSIYWDTIYFFYIGLKKDCPELLVEILNLKPKTDAQSWNRIVNLSNYLLAGFSSPYDIVSNNLHLIMLESSKLFRQIVTKEIKSPLAKFPEIYILWLFQLIIRESYSYDFFKNAVDSMNLLIEATDKSFEEKVYALFFTAVIAMDLSEQDPFDFILDTYGDQLPIQLKLAISHEGDKLKHISNHVKKNIKKLKQLAKTSDTTRALINSLYEKPLELRKLT